MKPAEDTDDTRFAAARQRREAARNDRRWFVVPYYAPPDSDNPCSGAEIHNRRGELIATFEDFDDAVRCVEAVNREASHAEEQRENEAMTVDSQTLRRVAADLRSAADRLAADPLVDNKEFYECVLADRCTDDALELELLTKKGDG